VTEGNVGQTAAQDPTVDGVPGMVRRARGDRTRVALVEAATALFAEKGVEATSVDEITAAASVAKGTFYVHFQRKQDVLLEQSARLVVRMAADPALTDPALDATAALHVLAELLADRAWTPNRALRGRAIREIIGNRDQWLRVLGDRPTLARVIEPIVARGVREGTLRTDLSPARLAHGLTILWLDTIIGWSEHEEERDLAQQLRAGLVLFLEGARTR
jgi:AcrR family transcriptional regulator